MSDNSEEVVCIVYREVHIKEAEDRGKDRVDEMWGAVDQNTKQLEGKIESKLQAEVRRVDTDSKERSRVCSVVCRL